MLLHCSIISVPLLLLTSFCQGVAINARHEFLNPRRDLLGPIPPSSEPQEWTFEVIDNTLHKIPIKGLVASTSEVLLTAWRSQEGETKSSRYNRWTAFGVNADFEVRNKPIRLWDFAWLALRTMSVYFRSNSGIPEFDGKFAVQDHAYVDKRQSPQYDRKALVLRYTESRENDGIVGASDGHDKNGPQLNVSVGNGSASTASASLGVIPRDPRFQISTTTLSTPVTNYRSKGAAILRLIRGLSQQYGPYSEMQLIGWGAGTTHTLSLSKQASLVITVLKHGTEERPILYAETLVLAMQALWAEMPDQYRGGFLITISIVGEWGSIEEFLKVETRSGAVDNGSLDASPSNGSDIVPDFTSDVNSASNGTLSGEGAVTRVVVS